MEEHFRSLPPDIRLEPPTNNFNHQKNRSRSKSRTRRDFPQKNSKYTAATVADKPNNGGLPEIGTRSINGGNNGGRSDVGIRSYANIVKKRSHEMSSIDADSLSFPPVRSSTGEIVIKIPKDLSSRSKEVWKYSLVGRFNFKTLGLQFEDAKHILCNQWSLTGQVQFIPWVRGYFIIKLFNEADRKRVSYEGPWKVKNQLLKVLPWTPMFNPESEKISRAAVWVRFPYLHLEYWEEEILFRIARGLGKPVAVDPRTLKHEFGYFAAVLIDIDFSKPLSNIVIDDEDLPKGFHIDYEIYNKPDFCEHCKSIGHVEENCRNKKYKDLKRMYDQETDQVKRATLQIELDELKNVWKKKEYTKSTWQDKDKMTEITNKPAAGVGFEGKHTFIPSESDSSNGDEVEIADNSAQKDQAVDSSTQQVQVGAEDDVAVDDVAVEEVAVDDVAVDEVAVDDVAEDAADESLPGSASADGENNKGDEASNLDKEEELLFVFYEEQKRKAINLERAAELARSEQGLALAKLQNVRKSIIEKNLPAEPRSSEIPDAAAPVTEIAVTSDADSLRELTEGVGFSSPTKTARRVSPSKPTETLVVSNKFLIGVDGMAIDSDNIQPVLQTSSATNLVEDETAVLEWGAAKDEEDRVKKVLAGKKKLDSLATKKTSKTVTKKKPNKQVNTSGKGEEKGSASPSSNLVI